MAAIGAWERELLDELRVARLATISADGRPQLVPVCYALVGNVIAVAVDEKPKRSTNLARLRNIARDPRVAFLADRYDDDWTRLAWVRIDGTARVAPAGREQPAAIEALRERYPQYRSMALEELPLILIEALRVSAWRWDQPSP